MVGNYDLDPFFKSVLELKSVKRAGWVSKVKVKSAESVADHTFATCAVGMLLADMTGVDTMKVMRMAVLHDLAESIVGDYMPGDVSVNEKVQEEKAAMEGILSGLPPDVRANYAKIWTEYLDNKTDIARFVHRIDKLEMAMQAANYASQGYDKGLLEQFFSSAKAAVGQERDIVTQTFARFAAKNV
jgi:putative hydrolase of HD superfamily